MRRRAWAGVWGGIWSVVLLALLVLPAGALPPETERGLLWLESQIGADGILATEGASIALPQQVRSETHTTLALFERAPPTTLTTKVGTVTGGAVELLARKALALQQAGADDLSTLTALVATQNPDGGFGALADYPSNPEDTAWALFALAARTAQEGPVAQKALAWLISVQYADGHWEKFADGVHVVPTALATQAVWAYRTTPTAQTALTQGRAWLMSQRNSAGHWATVLETAQALIAVLPGLSDLSTVQPALNDLKAQQTANGSWQNDPYLTALALRVLYWAGLPSPNPDLASITGLVSDGRTQLLLANITVNLRGTATRTQVTGAGGDFRFVSLAPGDYTLEIPAQGLYKPLLATLRLSAGQRLDMGKLLLSRETSTTTATLTGKVTRSDTGAPLAGVTIQAGALTALTDANGNYQIPAIPAPASLTLTATLPNYRSAIAQVNVLPGYTVLFSPSLIPLVPGGSAAGEIKGMITDAITNQPLVGVSLSVSGAFTATALTDADGRFRITPLPTSGAITMTATRSGYRTATATATVATDSVIEFSPRLVPSGTTADKGQIFGTIEDATTGARLVGVVVSTGALSATTDSQGSYLINNVPAGAVRLMASKAGYASVSGEGAMVAGGLLEFSPKMQPATLGLTASVLFGTVKSAQNKTPISGATVYVSGPQTYTATTAADGHYRIEGMAAGSYSVTISHPDYRSATVDFTLPARTEIEFSPALSDSSAGASLVPNSASLSGRLIDSSTQQPIAGASYLVSGTSRDRGVNRFGRFTILGVTTPTVTVTFNAGGYRPLTVQLPVTPLRAQEIGDFTMERVTATVMPDVAVAKFDITNTHTDPDTLQVSGAVAVEVINQGGQATTQPIAALVFEDLDRDGHYNAANDVALGEASLGGGLAVAQTRALSIPVSGRLRYRDSPLRLWVDSHNAVVELDENNNYDLYGTAPNFSAMIYTTGADFDAGRKINVVVDDAGDALRLAKTIRPFDNIWIANSGLGTVLKVDINTGKILGEYRSAPDGRPKNPSRTTVDQNGNVWVANRDESGLVTQNAIAPGVPPISRPMGSIIKIGLLENGQCEDRNGNGRIDTSTGAGDLRAWTNTANADSLGGVTTAEDECILEFVRVNSYGTRHLSVNRQNQVWVSGTGGRYFDLVSEDGRILRQEDTVYYGGYGGLIDANDVIWSSTNGSLLRWDTHNPLNGPNGGNWQGINRDSYGLCIDSHGNVWDSRASVYRPDGSLLRTYGGGYQGCTVDTHDDIWVANQYVVRHFKNDGAYLGEIYTGSVQGLSVDANGKIWAVGGERYQRIDPLQGPLGADGMTRLGAIDLTGPPLPGGSSLYNYSDMTGSTLTGSPPQGTWTTVYDSGKANTAWGLLNWHALIAGDSKLTVTVASSLDCVSYSAPVIVTSGEAFSTVPAGRCLKVNVHFKRATTGESPVLYDLTVRPAVPDLTAGQLRAREQTPGAGATLQASIGNASPFAAGPFKVTFWKGDPAQSGLTLGSVMVAGLAADHYETVSLPGLHLTLGESIFVQADSTEAYAEYNERNNWASGPLAALNALAQLTVATDKIVYSAYEAVAGSARVANLGTLASEFRLRLWVQDEQGHVVADFGEKSLGSLAPNTTHPLAQPWNTGKTLAGRYWLEGQLRDRTGQVVAEDQTPFDIVSTVSNGSIGAAEAALRLVTDRQDYAPDDRVMLESLALNLSVNRLIEGAHVSLEVLDPLGTVIFNQERALGQITLKGAITFSVGQVLRGALLGEYSVRGVLRDANNTELAQARTTYRVVTTAVPINRLLAGTVQVAYPTRKPGEPQSRTDTVRALGSAPLPGQTLARSLIHQTKGIEITRQEDVIDLASGAEKTWPQTPIDTHTLAPGAYVAVLLARSGALWSALAFDTFAIEPIGRLEGRVKVAVLEVKPGDAQFRDDTVHNAGTAPLVAQRIARVLVRQADSTEILRQEETLDLAPGAEKTWPRLPIATTSLALGTYIVSLVGYIDSQWRTLDSATFRVMEDPSPQLVGTVEVASAEITVGDPQHRLDTVRHTGTAPLTAQRFARVLIRAVDNSEITRQEATFDLAAGASKVWPQTPIDTTALKPGPYVVALLTEIKQQWQTLAFATFRVTDRQGPASALTGTVRLASTELKAGEPQSRLDGVRNSGTVPRLGQRIARVLVRQADGVEISRQEETIDLAPDSEKAWPRLVVDTHSLGSGHYVALLMAQVDGQWRTLDFASFRVVASPTATQGIEGTVRLTQSEIKAGDPQARTDVVRNTGANALTGQRLARVLIRHTDNAEVLRLEETVDLASGAEKRWSDTPLATGQWVPGGYTALLLASLEGQWRILDFATFRVVGAPGGPTPTPTPTPTLQLEGTVHVAHPVVLIGDPQSRTDTVRNTGTTPLSALRIARVLTRNADAVEITRIEQTLDLAPGTERRWADTPLETSRLLAGVYTVTVQAWLDGQWKILAKTSFQATPAAIPTLSGPATLLLSGFLLILGLVVVRRSHLVPF